MAVCVGRLMHSSSWQLRCVYTHAVHNNVLMFTLICAGVGCAVGVIDSVVWDIVGRRFLQNMVMTAQLTFDGLTMT